MNPEEKDHTFGNAVCRLLVLSTLLCATFGVRSVNAADGAFTVPRGTILPVRLDSTISSDKSKSGQVITGRIMQDVPLASGILLHAGSKVIGHIMDVSSATNGGQARISFRFDKLISSGRTIPVRTNLRAVASVMTVTQAEASNDNPHDYFLPSLIGGDIAYQSGGGSVTAPDGAVVGKSVKDGVLDQVRASNRQGRDCRGPVDGKGRPAAMWVFSSDACGTYDLPQISVTHSGRTQPVGVIILISEKGQFNLPRGTGMLLRVDQ
jgi:hypothetical protein